MLGPQRYGGGGKSEIKAAPTLYAPLAKWPMLITGNCRCLKTDGSIIPICDAVHTDIEASESIYNWVSEIVRRMGANATDLVPFRYYGKVSKRLKAPSSYARSIAAKSLHVERIDKLIQLTGKSFGMSLPELDQLVSHVDDFG